MKKFMLLGVVLFLNVCVYAAAPVSEAPIKGYGTPVTIAISSTTLTKVPSSQTSGRIGIFLDAPYSNVGIVSGFFGDCTSTALAITIRPLEFTPGNSSAYIPIREDVCLWMVSLDTTSATSNVHYQEVKQ